MSWLSTHRESESLAAAGHETLRRGDIAQAQDLFRRAAEFEARALEDLDSDKPRTLGITAVSAVALWYKSGDLKEAAQLAHQASAKRGMPDFALQELRQLLQAIWNEDAQRQAGISFVSGQVIISIKGGEIVTGGAPLDIIIDKVQIIQNLFYRTAEFIQSLPLRKRGLPSKELQEQCRPWLFQSVPGSYQFSVSVQKPRQEELFPTGTPEPEVLTETFLSILRAAGENPEEGLSRVVPNLDYRTTFLKMTRNLAPTGRVVETIEVRGPGDHTPIVLSSGSRKLISDTLRDPDATGLRKNAKRGEITLHGVLRALDLDNDWLEVSVQGSHKRVTGVSETVDDLIGPMVNRDVNVSVRPGRGRSLIFIDIEQDE
jgi:hypothetical protein